MTAVVHIAGLHVQVDALLRQRCAWCGAVLIDYDLDRVAVPVRQDRGLAAWEPGVLVLVDGAMSLLVDHEDGDPLPKGACAKVDPEATR